MRARLYYSRENVGGNALPSSMHDVAAIFDASYPMFFKGLGYRNTTKREKEKDPIVENFDRTKSRPAAHRQTGPVRRSNK